MSGAEIFLGFLLFPGLLFTAAAGLLTSWVDRKVTAMVQMRVGPPLLQPFYDIRKYFIKETCVPEGGATTHFTPNASTARDGALSRYISCIQGDAQGNLWMGTALGLARFDSQSETFSYFDARVGLTVGEGISCAQSKDGEMFFGSWQGLNTFFPDKIRDNPNPPAVVITALNLRDKVLRATCNRMSRSGCPTRKTTSPSISPTWTTRHRPRTSMRTKWKGSTLIGSWLERATMPTTLISSREAIPSG